MTRSDDLKLFQDNVDAIESVGGTVGQNGKLIEEEISNLGVTYGSTNGNNKRIMYVGEVKSAKECYLTVTYLMGSD